MARAEGQVLLNGENIYAPDVDPILVRRKIGMVFQQPIALRTRSIFENVAIGLRLAGINDRRGCWRRRSKRACVQPSCGTK